MGREDEESMNVLKPSGAFWGCWCCVRKDWGDWEVLESRSWWWETSRDWWSMRRLNGVVPEQEASMMRDSVSLSEDVYLGYLEMG